MLISFSTSDFILNDIFADDEKITVKSFTFENTSIIEFTNNDSEDIKTVRIWLDDNVPLSLKTENNWISMADSQNIMTFTTMIPIKQNEIVKFGIISEQNNSSFQWELLGVTGNSLHKGQTLIQNELLPEEDDSKSVESTTGILPESTFTIVPKSIHPGSTIRAIGNGYVPNSHLTLFLNGGLLENIETTDDGNFISTFIIPVQTKIGKLNFLLKDTSENEKTDILNLTNVEQEISEKIKLIVTDISSNFLRTEQFEFSGTATPETSIVLSITNSKEKLFSTETTNTNSIGNWMIPITIPFDAPIDTYTAEIINGENIISKSWDVVLSKKIHISPSKQKFQPDETMTFIGSGNPGSDVIVKIVNPNGIEVSSSSFLVDDSGFFIYEYPTSSSTLKGTYVLYAFQDNESEIIFIGLGKSPDNIFSVQTNYVNNVVDEDVLIGITGLDSQEISLSILNENNHEIFDDKIKLGPDGKLNYYLDISEFTSGIYTAFVSMVGLQTSDVFTVDLQYASQPIALNIVEKIYYAEQIVSVTGTAPSYTSVDLFLINPDRILIDQKESFADGNGNLHAQDFLIPSHASFGKWTVRSESGPIYDEFKFQVFSLDVKDLDVNVTDIITLSSEKLVTISGFTVLAQNILVTIASSNGDVVYQSNLETEENGEFDLLWTAKSRHIPGSYSVTVEDSDGNTSSAFFDL
jgi:hypothetical protein